MRFAVSSLLAPCGEVRLNWPNSGRARVWVDGTKYRRLGLPLGVLKQGWSRDRSSTSRRSRRVELR